MRAIVTGGLGFIGSHLSERLVADGWEVTVIDDGRTAAVADVAGATVRHWAIEEDAYLPRVDVVFHLASPVGPLGVMRWAGSLARQVVADAHRVGRWAWDMGAVLVDVSTSEVYGSGHQDREDDDCTFRHPTSARKEYAVAKLAAETMLRNTPDLDVRIVRPFNVAGPRQKPDGGFVLPRFLEQAERGEPLTVYTPGTQRRAFTHVADIVDGLLLAAGRGKAGEVYNLGNPANECSILQLAHDVLEVTGSTAGYAIVDPHVLHGLDFADAPAKIPDPSKAVRELGWQPRRSRLDCIRDAMRVAA